MLPGGGFQGAGAALGDFRGPLNSPAPLGGGNFSRGPIGAQGGPAGDRGAAPGRNELGEFLGLPSDQGRQSTSGERTAPENVDVNYGAAEGPRGGVVGEATVTGPNDNSVGRAGAVGPNGGVAGARGFQGANGAGGVQAAAVGPGGHVAAGEAIFGPEGGVAARGVVAGPAGVAGGYARVSPSGRYATAGGVRTGFDSWNLYGERWYVDHPGAWYAAGWTAGAAWNAATWDSLGLWMAYYPAEPVYYDYGTNVVYQNGDVYIGDQSAGTADQYYAQAAQLASAGVAADAASDDQWLPLGVFALTKSEEPSGNLTLQLAVDKQGILRGNYTDSSTGTTQLVQGSVDKQTQRAAFTIGDQTQDVVETGIYNLTRDEAPVLIHFGKERTEQWLLVRLKNPQSGSVGAAVGATGAN
jgi:hypothetical protein